MKYRIRYILLLLFDAVLINLAVYVMLMLRFDALIPVHFKIAFFQLMPLITIITLVFLSALKLYNRVWEYASIGELLAIVRATTFSMALIVMIIYLFDLPTLPRTVYIGSWVFMNVFIGASRVWWRVFSYYWLHGQGLDFQKVLVIGAGDAAVILLKEIENNPRLKMKVMAIVDDDPAKQGMILCNTPILGTRKNIESLVSDLAIDEIIIAIPSATGETIRQLVDICKKTPARLRTLPGIYQSMRGMIKTLRDVQMEDLLRREPVQINLQDIAGYIGGKTVLITGAGGSIGSELCRQVASQSPGSLIMLDCCENNLFDIENELKEDYKDISIIPVLADIKNEVKLENIFNTFQPHLIFHAAAYKHVPMMERHPEEAIDNNVLGTLHLARLSVSFNVQTFIYISTDKAVNPTSVMGASKRIAELIIKDANSKSPTCFASVRFGNVLGSRGSVIPTFMKQIEKGGPVTVTHPDMMRYFMTIPEAVQLVIQAGAMAEGGETFVLDMGQMIKIDDLARDLIQLAGYEVGKDIEIEYTGVRPGEKLYEELFTDPEGLCATRHQRIFISKEDQGTNYLNLSKHIDLLITQPKDNFQDILRLIRLIVPNFRGNMHGLDIDIVEANPVSTHDSKGRIKGVDKVAMIN